MKFKIKRQRKNGSPVFDPSENLSVYPIVNELRNSSRIGAVMIALETAFWTKNDLYAAFDIRNDVADRDLRSLQLDCAVVGQDMRKAIGSVRQEIPKDQGDGLPDPTCEK